MPEGIKCPHCGLVQYRPPDNLCKRCKEDLDTPPEVPPAPIVTEEPPPPKKGIDPAAIPLLIIGGLLLLFIIYALFSYTSWFHLKGGSVHHFIDTTGLIETDFPSGWHYMGVKSDLKNNKIDFLGGNDTSVIESIRGSFYMGSKYHPKAALYIRLQGLGVAGALGMSSTGQSLDKASPQIIGKSLQIALASQVSAAGGTYKPLDVSSEPLDRFKTVRCDGIMKTDRPILLWRNGGEYHVTILYFKESTRLYWYFIFIPENIFSETWPVVRTVLDATKINQAAF